MHCDIYVKFNYAIGVEGGWAAFYTKTLCCFDTRDIGVLRISNVVLIVQYVTHVILARRLIN